MRSAHPGTGADAEAFLWRCGLDVRRVPSPPGGFPIWLIDTAGCRQALPATILSDEERARADRFSTSMLRNRYIAAHASLRIFIRKMYGVPFDEIKIAHNAFGKPYIDKFDGIHANISYSEGFVAIGLGYGDEIGVDIEVDRPISDALELAPLHFTQDEQAEIRRANCSSSDAASRAFLKAWVRKEAVVKAIGCGLSMPINTIECGCGDGEVMVSPGEGRRYRTGIIELGGDPILAWARNVA